MASRSSTTRLDKCLLTARWATNWSLGKGYYAKTSTFYTVTSYRSMDIIT